MAATQPAAPVRPEPRQAQGVGDWLRGAAFRGTSALVVGVSRALRLLPLPQRYLPADAITGVVAAVWPRRAMVRHNYAVVTGLPEADPRVRRLARTSVRNFGRMAIDFLAACTMDAAELRAWVRPRGEEFFEDAIAHGHGVILAMPHMGSWDVGGAYAPVYGFPVTVVVEGHALAQIVEGARRYENVRLVARDRSLRALYEALARNEGVVLLSDIIHGAVQTVEVPFFGKPAPFPVGPARLALHTGAPLMVLSCVRLDEAQYQIEVRPPIWPERQAGESEAAAVERVTTALAAGFQQVIARYPEHWYPFHRIWGD